jgi:nucleoside-diphosphate-sugar epimerase
MAVEDVAGALVALLASNHEGPVNVATGRCVPVRHIIETIATLAGGNELVRFGARPPSVGEPARLGANIARLRDIMGFQPSLTLEDGLAATVRWWRDGETDARIGSIQVMQGNA